MPSRRLVLVFVPFMVLGCEEDDRNDPAPPGMSGGSVTVGGGGGSSASTTTAGTGGPGGSDPSSPSSPSASASDSDTGDITDTGAGTGPGDPTDGVSTGDGVDCAVPGASCAGDGVCVEVFDGSGGSSIVCSQGGPGEPCSVPSDCDSLTCEEDVSVAGSLVCA